MVAKDQIRKLSTKYQTSELNVIREYLQHLFLQFFYQLPQSSDIYFKGGTALRLVYQSARFSEDLDFSTNKQDIPGIENMLLEVLGKFEKENIQVTLREAKTTSGGYLAAIDFALPDQTVSIQIEISFREKENRGEVVTVASDFIVPYTLVALAKDQLVSGKIQALKARKKARDFYDLYFILRKQLLITDKRGVLSEVLNVLHSLNINFEKDLKQFLPKSHWAIIKDFKKTLEKELIRFI
ncbi:nucleotidyl transferase AbiEii/AbiGii toxin family protein [Candidatus Daviesbacteria bacterium]|nr:nucleotidyl transferase AbiEii/AbiGii toxin family protein [Candidatus Daviesbacteria bacterium]